MLSLLLLVRKRREAFKLVVQGGVMAQAERCDLLASRRHLDRCQLCPVICSDRRQEDHDPVYAGGLPETTARAALWF